MKITPFFLALVPVAAAAATITVNSAQDNPVAGDGRCTLREAIANVNTAAETTGGDCAAGTGAGDTIIFSLRLPVTMRRAQLLGELTVQRDVIITGPANATVRISGAGKTRVFEIMAGTTQMSGVTIQSGMSDQGGGVLVDSGASLNLTNCILKSNRATVNGGGIYNDGGAVSLTNCKLTRNKANNAAGDGDGGGMYNAGGTATLTTCTLNRNRARGHGDLGYRSGQGQGGGLYNRSTLNLTDCTLSRNWAIGVFGDNVGGGGLYNGGAATLTNCVLNGNRTSNYGGGLYNAGTLNLTGSTVSGNKASGAGGVNSDVGTLRLTNCTVSGNRAHNTGGGLIIDSGSAALTNSTITGNHAGGPTGGIFGAEQVTFTNTIVANNTSHDGRNCFNAGGVDAGHNLDDGVTCGFKGVGCAATTGSSFCNTNPQLDPAGLKNSGGATQTIALCTGPGTPAGCTGASPAIDAGDDAVTSPPDNLTTDQRGLPRLSGAHVDIGAYEVQQ